jgi:pilus assembly protein FimV
MNFTRLPTGFLGVEMSVTMRRLILMACLLSPACIWPSLSWALGLGEIHLNSALNEPMRAEIDLIAASPDELTALHAELASRDAFTRYGIDRPPFLSTLTFKVGKGKDGRDVLLVRSTDAIPEPFVTFLVEVNWARGRLMREYTVLLDPPVYTPGETASSSTPVTAPASAAPARRPAPPPRSPRLLRPRATRRWRARLRPPLRWNPPRNPRHRSAAAPTTSTKAIRSPRSHAACTAIRLPPSIKP